MGSILNDPDFVQAFDAATVALREATEKDIPSPELRQALATLLEGHNALMQDRHDYLSVKKA